MTTQRFAEQAPNRRTHQAEAVSDQSESAHNRDGRLEGAWARLGLWRLGPGTAPPTFATYPDDMVRGFRWVAPVLALVLGVSCGGASKTGLRASSTAVTSSSTSTTPPTTQPATTTTGLFPAQLAAFVGTWNFHGFGAHISPDGSGQAYWRIYKWCSSDPTPPCDGMDGNNIIDGGQATFSITTVNGTTAAAIVQRSTDPHTVPTGLITLRLQPGDHLDFNGAWQPLCGPSAPPDTCGA